jgi:hypothetical protein
MRRLKLKVTETAAGRHLCLCDEAGVALGGQVSVTLHSEPDKFDTATVVFMLGDEVKVVGEDQ